MSTNEVKALVGPPVYTLQGDYQGADFGTMWVYCLKPHGAQQTEPDRHPHYLVKFSKEEAHVQKTRPFSDVERRSYQGHNEEKIPYVFPENFFAVALSELPPVHLKLNTGALKEELNLWLRERLPGKKDIERLAAIVFEEQVKADITGQIEHINREANKMLREPGAGVSPGMISLSGPGAMMRKRAKDVETGLTTAVAHHYFLCEPETKGRWVVRDKPHPSSISNLSTHAKIALKPIPIQLEALGGNRREEFQPLCEVEVRLSLDFSGRTLGECSPAQGLHSSIKVQPAAVLTVSRTVKTGRSLDSLSIESASLERAFAPESLCYTASFKAERDEAN